MLIFDSTLRDGSHQINHQLTKENIKDYCQMIDDANMHTVIVGHGNGLGASSLNVGLSLLTDEEMLTIAKKKFKENKVRSFSFTRFRYNQR